MLEEETVVAGQKEPHAALSYPLTQIYFYLTEGCNLHCRHCWIDPSFQAGEKVYPSLSLKHFLSIIDEAIPLGLQDVKLTGGEPLLHPEIKEILEAIRKKGLRCVVETNGVLCNPEIAALIAECKSPFVSVSLDGVDAETHEWVRGVAGCFDAAVRGIGNLVDAGIRPQIIMTIMRHNRHQVEAMVRLAEHLNAGSLKFNLLSPIARGEEMHDSGESLSIKELVEMGNWVENELSSSTRIKLLYSHASAFRPLHRMYGGDGCGVCNIKGIIGVLSDGTYALCGIGESIPELTFGNVETDRLSEVWRNNPILRDVREGLPGRLKGVCGTCLMKDLCKGYCVAQNYYRTKDLWAPFYYCEEALKLGIFPATRLMPRTEHELTKTE